MLCTVNLILEVAHLNMMVIFVRTTRWVFPPSSTLVVLLSANVLI